MKLLRFFRNFFCVYIAVVFVLLASVAPIIGYTYKRLIANMNLVYIAIALVAGFIIVYLLKRLFRKRKDIKDLFNSSKFYWRFLVIGSAVLLAMQIFVALGGWFIVGWDTRNVIFPDMQTNFDYMSMYPNQLMLAGIFRRIYFFLTNNFGFSFEQYYLCLVLLSVIVVLATVVFTSLIAKKISSNFIGWVTFLIAAIFIGLSPWIMVPYSDTMSMVCTSFVLLMYVCKKCSPLRVFLIVFVSIIGAAIKPTAIAVFTAIIFVEAVSKICIFINNKRKIKMDANAYPIRRKSLLEKFFHNEGIKKTKFKIKKINKRTFVLSTICIIIAIGSSVFLANKLSNYDVQVNDDRSLTFTHFLMMGINQENRGAWNNDDVNISRSYKNVEQREEANIKEWQTRLKHNGLSGTAEIFLNKTMTNFGDGTFCWEAEKPWCIQKIGNNPIVNKIYGLDQPNETKEQNNLFAYPFQVIWFMILAGCALLIFKQRPKKAEVVICCSLLAISAFLTLFEPDPRYLILYVPFFVILGVKGWSSFATNFTIK